ncbi:MAG: ABC transporter ATP-binding protein [Longimicrobiales bacterium]
MELSAPLLRAERLQRRYGSQLVVDVDVLEVRAGEIVAVLGPNGAGKSTLFRMLLLLERPDAGRVLLDGRPVRTGETAAMRRLAGVFQEPFLFDGTVQMNVEFGLRGRKLSRTERTERARGALSWLGLEALSSRRVRTLSGGEAQRVALARALVLAPDLLLLDEPTANLDATVRRRFREDLEILARTHARAALMITHDPTDAFSLADRIAVMQSGRIVQHGTPEALVLEPATPFVATFTGAELLLDGVVRGFEEELPLIELTGGAVVLATVGPEADRPAVGARVHVAYRPEDVVLTMPGAEGVTSAVNRFPAEVAALIPAGGLVRVRLRGAPELAALVTRRSVETLGLAPGKPVVAQLKAAALRAFPSP